MGEIKAVLLVPEPGDPHGLLAEGPCGARPPMATHYRRGWRGGKLVPSCAEDHADTFTYALVLAWDGEPVPEGVDRLARAGWWADRHQKIHDVVRDLLRGNRRHLRLIRSKGTLVLLDAEGREVTP